MLARSGLSGLERPTRSRGGLLSHALLAGLCLAALAVTLQTVRHQALLGDRLVHLHEAWSAHLERVGRMGQIALAISAPSNEVFDSDRLEAELTRSRRARGEFIAAMDSARSELAQRLGASSSHLADLDAVRKAIGDMIVDVDRIFASYGVGPPPEVVVIDVHMTRINEGLVRVGRIGRAAEAIATRKLLDSAVSRQRATSTILAMILVLVIAIVGNMWRLGARRPAGDTLDDPTQAPPVQTSSLVRWLRLAIPVGLCAFAMAVSLHTMQRRSLLRGEIMASNQAWSERMARYGRMGQLPLAISAPCNEVFDSGDLERELARSRQARAAFSAEMDSARLEVAALRAGVMSTILEALDAVQKATGNMIVDVDNTFASYGVGRPPDISVIDWHLAAINEGLAALERRAREAQSLDSQKLLVSAALSERMFSSLLVVLAVLAAIAGLMPILWRRRAGSVVAAVPAPVDVVAEQAPALVLQGDAQESREASPDTPPPGTEALMPSVLLAAPDPVITLDGSGRIIGWNARASSAFGRSFETVRGARFSETLLAPAHRDAIERVMRRLLEHGDERDLSRRFEIAALDQEGREFPVELAIVPDRAGDALVFNLFLRDISRRRRIEAALRESEARSRAVIEEAADGILTFDDAGTITSANPASERIFGHRPGELVGRPVHTLMSDLAAGNGGHDSAARSRPWTITGGHELMGRRRNGSVFPVELSTTETQGDGLRSWTGIVRDLTQRKQAEALQAGQNRFLELLASGARLSDAFAELTQTVEAQLTGAVCMVVIVQRGQTRLSVCASPSLPGDFRSAAEDVEIGPAGCSWGAAVHSRQRVIADDTATNPSWAGFRQLALYYGLRSCWAEPILSASGHALGAFAVFHRRVHAPDAFELELVSSAVHLASLAIEHTLAHSPLAAGPEVEEAGDEGLRSA